MTKKIVLEDLDNADFLHSALNRVAEFYSLHRKKVQLVTGAVALVLLALSAWFAYRYTFEKNAWEGYAEITEATLTQSSVNEDDLIKKYGELAARYSGSKAAVLSSYRLGNLYFNEGKIDSAIKSYEKFLADTSDRNDLKVLAYSSLANCYETKKDYKKALLALQQAEKTPAGKNFGTFLYRDMGRIYEKMENPAEALKYYKKALEQSLDPTVTSFIKRKIAILS